MTFEEATILRNENLNLIGYFDENLQATISNLRILKIDETESYFVRVEFSEGVGSNLGLWEDLRSYKDSISDK